jgi:hypothetical protein
MIKERLDPSERDVLKLTDEHLHVCLSLIR